MRKWVDGVPAYNCTRPLVNTTSPKQKINFECTELLRARMTSHPMPQDARNTMQCSK